MMAPIPLLPAWSEERIRSAARVHPSAPCPTCGRTLDYRFKFGEPIVVPHACHPPERTFSNWGTNYAEPPSAATLVAEYRLRRLARRRRLGADVPET
jgi:hypothetical protein